MSGPPKAEDDTLLKRIPVIVRSWDGPNSRLGLEVDLGQMPWGPFEALGKRLNLLVPPKGAPVPGTFTSESQVERALRHVEHAADRCAEFAQISNGNQELWLRSQKTWEWIRQYLTSLWVEEEVEGEPSQSGPEMEPVPDRASQEIREAPFLPGAASTLRVAARALRATPLAVWRENMGPPDLDAPTREEAVQTLLGVARILGGEGRPGGEADPAPSEWDPSARGEPKEPLPEPPPARDSDGGSRDPAETDPSPADSSSGTALHDPDQVSFDFAQGYDQGYQMGRRVGMALGAMKKTGTGTQSE